jgi:hypothetical protein
MMGFSEYDCHDMDLANAGRMIDELEAKNKKLEDICFELGAMDEPPCFLCGYDGPGYYQPDKHKCAERHHSKRRK